MISVTYIDHLGTDLRIVNSARVSFNKKSQKLEEKDKKLIKYLADHQHMSPFEHCSMTVLVECPIYIAAQVMRHRTMAYNMVSRRYTSEAITFYEPEYRPQAADNRQASDDTPHTNDAYWQLQAAKLRESSLSLYLEMLADGVCREQARGILPQDLMTKFYMTGNLRNLVHFISLRSHKGAQAEIRLISDSLAHILKVHFPVAMEALKVNGDEETA